MKIKRIYSVGAMLFTAASCFCGGVYAQMSHESPVINLRSYASTNSLDYHWDEFSKIAAIFGPSGQARFEVGSELCLSQSRLSRLDQKVYFKDGTVFIPSSAKNVLDLLCVRSPMPAAAVLPRKTTISEGTTYPARVNGIHKITLDSGHGGYDLGATGLDGIREKDLVLGISQKLRRILESRNLEVIMTRQTDNFIPLNERARISNKKEADLFVSIHGNASRTRGLKGFEVYYLSEATDDQAMALERAENTVLKLEGEPQMETSREVRTIVWDLKEAENRRQSLRLARGVVDSVQRTVMVSAGRVRAANFHVLRNTESPSVLIEIGYLTNREDKNRLMNPAYCDKLAQAIADGVLNYKNEYEQTNGFTT